MIECDKCGLPIDPDDDKCVYCQAVECRVCMVGGNGGDCPKSETGRHEAFHVLAFFDDPGY